MSKAKRKTSKASKPRKASKPHRIATAKGIAKAPRKPSKPRKAASGGGKALSDFVNGAKIKVLQSKAIARRDCFRTGQTVAQCLEAQKLKGFRGRRKYIRKQVALERIALR